MDELVTLLSQARRDREITLKQISEKTKIQLRYLQALESGDFSVFAGEVYLKGALCNYAEIVGLDTGEVLALYHRLRDKAAAVDTGETDTAAADPVAVKPKATPKPKKVAAERPQGSSLKAGMVVLVLLMISVAIWFSFNRPWQERDPLADPGPAENGQSGDTGDESAADPDNGQPRVPAVDVFNSTSGETTYNVSGAAEILIRLNFSEPCWVQLKVDGEELFYPRTFPRGDEFETTADREIWMRLGNPRGVGISVNDIEIEGGREHLRPHNFVFNRIAY
ncbi:MAG: RodZ domain-containing protein [Bacillota bacterium]